MFITTLVILTAPIYLEQHAGLFLTALIYIEQYAGLLCCGQLDYKPTMVLSIMVVQALQKIEVNIRKLQKG
jgi:hypothetical protein